MDGVREGSAFAIELSPTSREKLQGFLHLSLDRSQEQHVPSRPKTVQTDQQENNNIDVGESGSPTREESEKG